MEIAKRVVDACNRRDIDVFTELATPDFEGGYRGREDAERLREIGEMGREFRAIAEEYRDLGDRVLVLGRLEGCGKGSGVPVDALQRWVLDFRGGKVSRLRGYLDHGEALRAAGLSE